MLHFLKDRWKFIQIHQYYMYMDGLISTHLWLWHEFHLALFFLTNNLLFLFVHLQEKPFPWLERINAARDIASGMVSWDSIFYTPQKTHKYCRRSKQFAQFVYFSFLIVLSRLFFCLFGFLTLCSGGSRICEKGGLGIQMPRCCAKAWKSRSAGGGGGLGHIFFFCNFFLCVSFKIMGLPSAYQTDLRGEKQKKNGQKGGGAADSGPPWIRHCSVTFYRHVKNVKSFIFNELYTRLCEKIVLMRRKRTFLLRYQSWSVATCNWHDICRVFILVRSPL